MNNVTVIIIYKDFSIHWLERLKKLNIKNIGLHTLYQYGGVAGYLDWLSQDSTKELIKKFEDEGFNIVHELHVIDYLLPRSLFEKDPSLFREDKDGKRNKDWNLCASNKKALKYIENAAFNLAEKLNQRDNHYYLWQDDCAESTCHCKKCRKLSPADQIMVITKYILKGLKRYNKNAKLSYLAYQNSIDGLTKKPAKDMFLQFAPINRVHNEPITSDNEKNAINRKNLEKLVHKFNEIEILEYYLDASYFCQWKRENVGPLNLNENNLVKDFVYYKSNKATSLSTFAGFIDNEWIEKFGEKDLELFSKTVNKYF